ncbi:MAG: hypothetical protein WEB00_09675 [Dehalococcoidia bacterium]
MPISGLLEQAVARLQERPKSEQDAVAALILQEIEDEQGWDERFANSQDLLEKLGDQALRRYMAGETEEI